MRADQREPLRFLATTANEDFWKSERPLILLGGWCKKNRPGTRSVTVASVEATKSLEDKEQVEKGRKYTKHLFDRTLESLAKSLNQIHQENHSLLYWKIILGPWLRWYVDALFIRYKDLMDVITSGMEFETIVLSEENFITPTDTEDFLDLTQTDNYNLQVYSRIFSALGMSFPAKTLEDPKSGRLERKNRFSFLYGIARKTAGMILHLVQERGSLFIVGSLFSKIDLLRYFAATRGKIFPLLLQFPLSSSIKTSPEQRSRIRGVEIENSPFESVLNRLLPLDIPVCFVEGYEAIQRNVTTYFPKKPKAIFSSNSWYFEEDFKLWAARSKESGAILIGTQHGGDYGSLADHRGVECEMDITDRYYTWGWEKTDCRALVLPFYATRLSGRGRIGAKNTKNGILFTTTDISRYPIYIYRHRYLVARYGDWQNIFLNGIHRHLRPKMRIRLHKNDPGGETRRRWASFAPDVTYDAANNSFLRSLKACRLFVCDHLSTTYIEALSANKPTVLFWDPENYDMTDDAAPYYEILKHAGILFLTPEAAAEKVNAVYPDVEGWWSGSMIQEAREVFTKRYGCTSLESRTLWLREMRKIMEGWSR